MTRDDMIDRWAIRFTAATQWPANADTLSLVFAGHRDEPAVTEYPDIIARVRAIRDYTTWARAAGVI